MPLRAQPYENFYGDIGMNLGKTIRQHCFGLVVLGVAFLIATLIIPPVARAQTAIAIHGGAGGNPTQWSEEYRQTRIKGLTAALELGNDLLEKKTPAIQVVEQVIRMLEDNEVFNAGRGCVLNAEGEHELDASIMDGKTLACGAVAGVKATRHPISLALRVMNETEHVLLSGQGADEFSLAQGLEQATPEHFRTEARIEAWKKWKQRSTATDKQAKNSAVSDSYFGTVGCVVLDHEGNLAAGTSTGGMTGKKWGRVGDSPIIGAGNYADNATCAVSGTGVGEEFIRHTVASDIAARMRYGNQPLENAAGGTIKLLPPNCGGVICVDKEGNVAMEFNTVGMSRAFRDAAGKTAVKLALEE